MKARIFVLLTFTLSAVFAQKPIITDDFSLEVGDKYKRVTGDDEYHFTFGQQMLSLKSKKNEFIVERHSLSNLKKQPNNTTINKKGDFVSVLQIKDSVLIYYRQKDKLYSQKVLISKKIIEKPKIVIDSKEKIADDFGFSSRFGYEAGGTINAFAIKKSVDGSKFLILYRNDKREKVKDKDRDVININVYNSDMTLDWKRSMPLPYYFKQMNSDDFMVDGSGIFYMLASKFEKDRVSVGKRNKLDTDFHMELFSTSKENTDWTISKLNTDKSIEDAVLYTSTQNEPIAIGFYGEESFKGNVTGAFVAKITGEKEIKPTLYPIPKDTLIAYETRRSSQVNKGKRDEDDFNDLEKIHINKVVSNNDGTYNIFAEQRYTLESSSYINGVNHVHYRYYYRNAYACKLNEKGTMDWFLQLPKNQMGIKGKQSMSYLHQYFGGHHYILVWDKFDNLRKSIGSFAELLTMNKQAYMFIAAYKINDQTGSIEKLPVLNALEVDKYRLTSFEMGKAVPINNSDLVIQGREGGKSYLFRLRGK